MSLRIVFMGTPDFAVPTLVEIVGRGHEVVGVYTRAPKPGGRRGLDLTPSPIEREARRFALPVFTPATRASRHVTASVSSASLLFQRRYSEAFPTPARRATASMANPAQPASANRSSAARAMRRSTPGSRGRPGVTCVVLTAPPGIDY